MNLFNIIRKIPLKSKSTDLRKLVKLSYAKELENGGYAYPGMMEYCDKGINDGKIYEPMRNEPNL